MDQFLISRENAKFRYKPFCLRSGCGMFSGPEPALVHWSKDRKTGHKTPFEYTKS